MNIYDSAILGKEEYELLKDAKIAVIGCGSLGGYVLEMLARFGVSEIVIVDDNVFKHSNVARQVMAGDSSVGKYKVNEAVRWIKQVNPSIYIKGIIQRLNKDNALDIIKGVDMVMDCVDNVETKFVLQDVCEQLNIPLIHGQLEGWIGHVSTILPKDRTLDKIYVTEEMKQKHIDKPSLIPAAIASYQVSEAVKVMLNKGEILRSKVINIDMLNNKSELVDLG